MTRKPPNIVFMMTDQQRTDTIAALGHPHMTTPHIDDLVNRGTAFTAAYVTSPSCAPSRASLFTGTYPHTNGVFRNDEPWPWCWVEMLADAGYRCVNVGKMHTMPIEAPFGFHERHVVENKDRDHPNLPFFLDQWDKALWTHGAPKPSRVSYRKRNDYGDRLGAFTWEPPEKLHPDVFTGDLAEWWLDRYTGDEPFFLQIGFPGPHPPYDPTERYLEPYLDRSLPKAIRDYDLDSQPTPMQQLRTHHQDNDHDAVVQLANPSDEQMHMQRAHYYANCTMIDDQVGKVIAALDRRGVLEDTIVIFTSDHGDCLNDHGHSQKWTMYEQSVRIPMIVAGPSVAQNHREKGLVALFDLGPTVLEAAGVAPPEWMEAQSLWPSLRGATTERDTVFAEHSDDKILVQTEFMTMIRKGDWKLVHFVDIDEGQLFDLANDPGERNSLWNEPACETTKRALLGDILNWRIQSDRKTQGFRQHLANHR